MPGLRKIINLQHLLDNFFAIEDNQYGFFCLPEPKIKFVCEQFLLKNPDFSNSNFKIKLSIDSTTITSSNILLLNLSFNLFKQNFLKNIRLIILEIYLTKKKFIRSKKQRFGK
jgi:hypothetical protein